MYVIFKSEQERGLRNKRRYLIRFPAVQTTWSITTLLLLSFESWESPVELTVWTKKYHEEISEINLPSLPKPNSCIAPFVHPPHNFTDNKTEKRIHPNDTSEFH